MLAFTAVGPFTLATGDRLFAVTGQQVQLGTYFSQLRQAVDQQQARSLSALANEDRSPRHFDVTATPKPTPSSGREFLELHSVLLQSVADEREYYAACLISAKAATTWWR